MPGYTHRQSYYEEVYVLVVLEDAARGSQHSVRQWYQQPVQFLFGLLLVRTVQALAHNVHSKSSDHVLPISRRYLYLVVYRGLRPEASKPCQEEQYETNCGKQGREQPMTIHPFSTSPKQGRIRNSVGVSRRDEQGGADVDGNIDEKCPPQKGERVLPQPATETEPTRGCARSEERELLCCWLDIPR